MNKPKKQKDRKSRAQVILHQKWKIVIPGKMEGAEAGRASRIGLRNGWRGLREGSAEEKVGLTDSLVGGYC